jgi:hypothetical protein
MLISHCGSGLRTNASCRMSGEMGKSAAAAEVIAAVAIATAQE